MNTTTEPNTNGPLREDLQLAMGQKTTSNNRIYMQSPGQLIGELFACIAGWRQEAYSSWGRWVFIIWTHPGQGV